MLKSELLKFKNLFESQKREILFTKSVIDQNLVLQKDDMLDDVDMTSVEMETAMRTRLLNREALFLKKVEEALVRIHKGEFGVCGDCGDDIEMKRLEARPTATLCVNCKESQERLEHTHIDGHKRKSLSIKLALA